MILLKARFDYYKAIIKLILFGIISCQLGLALRTIKMIHVLDVDAIQNNPYLIQDKYLDGYGDLLNVKRGYFEDNLIYRARIIAALKDIQ